MVQTLNAYMGDILERKSRAAGLSGIEPWGSLTVDIAVLGRPLLPAWKGRGAAAGLSLVGPGQEVVGTN